MSAKNREYVLEFPADYKPTIRNHPLYGLWGMMLTRCRNKKATKYCDYGGRGIAVCKRWEIGESGFTGFQCFMMDMGNKPTSEHSLDRKDNNGNYCKENCRWATPHEQARNRRNTHMLTYRGDTMSMLDLAERTGISYYCLRNRISRGWPVEDAVHQPKGAAIFAPKTAVGARLPQTKLTEEEVIGVRKKYAAGGFTMEQLAIGLNVSTGTVFHIIRRKTWAHVK